MMIQIKPNIFRFKLNVDEHHEWIDVKERRRLNPILNVLLSLRAIDSDKNKYEQNNV